MLVKFDGLPYGLVDRFVKERDPRTGKSQLPWIDHIYYQRGARLANFYVRGMSLSGPSWSLLETGQHLQIKGNVEFDRFTLKTYDYLNFVPFIVLSATGERVDMAAVEVLDSLKTPMLVDAYPHNERYVTFSLFQRGPRFVTYQNSLLNKFKRAPRDIFDEWTMGFDFRNVIPEELLRELIANVADPKVRYLDIVLTDFDHIAHHNNDRESHLIVLKQLDSIIGQIWTAIQRSPLAGETAMIVVSDHGFNTDEKIYSQGYNLVKLLGSAAGGGHHVITKRRLMLDYAIKGMNPFVPLITTTTPDSLYLKDQSATYPTAMLDFDGNERASIHLRDSNLNLLHILWQQLRRTDLSERLRSAATDAFFQTLNKRRGQWQQNTDALNEELGALRRSIAQQEKLWAARPKTLTKEEVAAGRDDEIKRIYVQLSLWQGQEKAYSAYAQAITNLLSLKRENFSAAAHKIETLIPPLSMGEPNSVYDLQNYVVGVGPDGLVLKGDGSLDLEKSFAPVDYFSLLHGLSVRNNVQRGVTTRPVDFIATKLSAELLRPTVNEPDIEDDVVWIYDGQDNQALILARRDSRGNLSFRYQPIKKLIQANDGRLHFEIESWRSGLPLQIFEDAQLAIPEAER
ncbi:MAG TPA: alkaline phosphatase family protein, partial [Pyrinomonadaceae bacterium]|nr:alkaline phosphatase family protein [Pyrinomonadaceae bacterium]